MSEYKCWFCGRTPARKYPPYREPACNECAVSMVQCGYQLKEAKEIKAQTVRQAARACQPLGGADAQELEGALQQTERDYDCALECIRDAKAVIGCLLTWYDESDLSATLANVPEALADIIAKALQWENHNASLWLNNTKENRVCH